MSSIDFGLLGLSIFAALYWLGALICVDLFGRRRPTAARSSTPVSVLKPLRGDDGQLYENLRSFCQQDCRRFEVIFGVEGLDDPAVAVVDRLIREFPHLELRLVVDDRAIGTNRKASNLANIIRQARHDTFIVADGDMRVAPAYIRTVVAPLEDRTVGLVTCLYYGVARRDVASRLNAMFINEWFLPAALVGPALKPPAAPFDGVRLGDEHDPVGQPFDLERRDPGPVRSDRLPGGSRGATLGRRHAPTCRASTTPRTRPAPPSADRAGYRTRRA